MRDHNILTCHGVIWSAYENAIPSECENLEYNYVRCLDLEVHSIENMLRNGLQSDMGWFNYNNYNIQYIKHKLTVLK